ncbi:MAG: camphor resistance protein CrcB [Hydrocarboniphaga sp.]|uniref:fluoride efflux transporter CrcB n=1 Tax=Hydrocarboniphaga sp. TaxID=2033016 RepID=UPI0026343093|nr:fluoride efflux transporter CrcB [Hydrocarboniphaga sp.]MDB5971256.1 camphor resistance protein CrcB [Hydrocarboniphaga sp.]
MYKSLLAVVIGGSIGCLLRFFAGVKLNSVYPNLPMGTLLVNLVGGLIIGMAVAFFARAPNLDPAWRVLIITGFCGGFTTFSAFSAEVMLMMQDGRLGWAAATVTTHVVGSLLMSFLGFALVAGIQR